MVDHVSLSENEEIKLDTTNNTITVVRLAAGIIEIRDSNGNLFATLNDWLDMFTLAIGTGVYTAKKIDAGTCHLIVVREFIY